MICRVIAVREGGRNDRIASQLIKKTPEPFLVPKKFNTISYDHHHHYHSQLAIFLVTLWVAIASYSYSSSPSSSPPSTSTPKIRKNDQNYNEKTQFTFLEKRIAITLKNQNKNPETFFQKKIATYKSSYTKNIFEIPLIPLKNTFFSKVSKGISKIFFCILLYVFSFGKRFRGFYSIFLVLYSLL